ncbi:MAG: hypothetical protein A2189_04135 [Paenibacillus sp. RIFOXYA1_FULL_44_5]|nr:MAG: hypothetical protein A2189_04135 [Paenibacillus sp. RIFOXYA1_FULL_44_5]
MYDLVAKSIPKLSYDNITISDQNGDLLAYSKSGGTQDVSSQVSDQMSIKRQFEIDTQKKVLQILGPMMGINKVIPIATASLNFDKKSTKSTLVKPVVNNQGIAVSLQEIQKSYSSDGGQTSGGVAGTGSTGVPGYPGSTGTGKSSSDETQTTTNYEVNHISEDVAYSPYVVKDLSISVGIEPPNKNDPNSLTQATKDAVVKVLESIVSASLADSGQTYTQQDIQSKVNLVVLPFNGTQTTTAGLSANTYLLWAAGAAVLLLAGGLVGLTVRRRRSARAAAEDLLVSSKPPVPTLNIDQVNDHEVRKQLETLARRKPEDFVNLLRTWLVDE